MSSLSALKRHGVSLSAEWFNGLVSSYRSSKTSQLTSLRTKIKEHKNSFAHMSAEKIEKKAAESVIEQVADRMNKEEIETTTKVMRTAYYIAKSDRPYSDQTGLLELQALNGINIGVGLRS